MFKALMRVQWKWTRGVALLATLLGFAIPIASVRVIVMQYFNDEPPRATEVVRAMQYFGVWYTLLAAGVGLVFALVAWAPDHRGRHVYALSLPITRSKYAAMRFGSGALFLILPTLGVLVGTLIASAIAPLPTGLQSYPIALTVRFLLSSAVAFSVFFAISASTPKAAGIVLGGIAAVFLVAFIFSLTGAHVDLLARSSELLFDKPGLLSVFTGRWTLFDV